MIIAPRSMPKRLENFGIAGGWPWPQSHTCVAGFLPSARRRAFTGWSVNSVWLVSMISRITSSPAPRGTKSLIGCSGISCGGVVVKSNGQPPV